MSVMCSVVLMVVGILAMPGGDAASLVSQLGSARYSEREAASQALQELGREAIPALVAARQDPDPEVRNRAAVLVDRIESDLVVKPTLLKLGYREATLGEILQDMSRQSRIGIQIFPENNPAQLNQRYTLVETEPVTFWQAIDRVSRLAKLQFNAQAVGLGAGARRGQPTIHLVTGASGVGEAFTDDSGPFRVVLRGITQHRERSFVSGALVTGGQIGGEGLGTAGMLNEQFYVSMQIVAEPRLSFSLAGSVRVTEAIDDLGQSLLVPENPNAADAMARQMANPGMMGGIPSSVLQSMVQLKYPARSGAVIKKLSGVAPLQVTARREEPTSILLNDESKGKTIQNGDMRVTFHEIRAEPVDQISSLELTIQSLPNGGNGGGGQAMGGVGTEMTILRQPSMGQGTIEIADAQGRLYSQWFPYNVNPGPAGLRVNLRMTKTDGIGPPAELRIYEMTRAQTEARFVFSNVPMP